MHSNAEITFFRVLSEIFKNLTQGPPVYYCKVIKQSRGETFRSTKCRACRELLFDIHIAYITNKLIEPRGLKPNHQFQKLKNFLEEIFKFFSQNRSEECRKPPNTKFKRDRSTISGPNKDMNNRYHDP